MTRGFSFSVWLRGLLAASLVLASLSPAPAAAIPDWLAGAICHAPSDGTPEQPSHNAHDHCALCHVAQAVGLPSVSGSLPLPTLAFAKLRADAPAGPARAFAFRLYASRAPPLIG